MTRDCECQKETCSPAQQGDTHRFYHDLEESVLLFRALADETRLAILRQLREQGEVCACDLQSCCCLAQPTVSHHLGVLRRAGLVKTSKRGLWVYYSLDEDKLAHLFELIP